MNNIGQRLSAAFLVVLAFSSAGCSVPMEGKDMAAVVRELKNDQATVCFSLSGRGGAGMMAVTPAPVPVGGYGSGEAFFCRSNQPNARITAESGKLTIEHGAGVGESQRPSLIERIAPLIPGAQ